MCLDDLYWIADWLVLHDISRDGRVLLARNTIRIAIACQPPGQSAERDLTWLGGSQVGDLTADGQTLIFAEVLGVSPSGTPQIFRRSTTGSPAIRLGDGTGNAISPDGKTIAFSYKGDIYIVPAVGGRAIPLTLHPAYESRPLWSPDGKTLAFMSDRHGNFDVFTMPASGGATTRLTTHSADEVPNAFTADGKNVLYSATIQDSVASAQFPVGYLGELYEHAARTDEGCEFTAQLFEGVDLVNGQPQIDLDSIFGSTEAMKP